MAYGIDVIAHKACIKNGIPTAGVLAHGLDMIYPAAHAPVAREMQQQGALLSEYFSHSVLEKGNFPTRNRIVAGLADATIVVETDIRGGSMITADIAFSYNREVYCFPGRSIDAKSAGCNLLIRKLKGQLITSADDIARELGWKHVPKSRAVQKELFIVLSEQEKELVQILQQRQAVHIDELMQLSNLNSSEIASVMLNLEMMNVIQIVPGKMISLSP
jgi:DNA processing protein